MMRRPPRSTPFPTRRSSDLERQHGRRGTRRGAPVRCDPMLGRKRLGVAGELASELPIIQDRSEEHTSELQSHSDLVCRLLLEKKKKKKKKKLTQTTVAQ